MLQNFTLERLQHRCHWVTLVHEANPKSWPIQAAIIMRLSLQRCLRYWILWSRLLSGQVKIFLKYLRKVKVSSFWLDWRFTVSNYSCTLNSYLIVTLDCLEILVVNDIWFGGNLFIIFLLICYLLDDLFWIQWAYPFYSHFHVTVTGMLPLWIKLWQL